jgi:nucleotidyltransferase/DNA polymerase involved in DNA repair
LKNKDLKVSAYSPIIITDLTNKNMPAKLNISFIPGLGRHTIKALGLYGIKTIEDLAKFSQEEIQDLLGNSGLKYWRFAKKVI